MENLILIVCSGTGRRRVDIDVLIEDTGSLRVSSMHIEIKRRRVDKTLGLHVCFLKFRLMRITPFSNLCEAIQESHCCTKAKP